MANTKKMVDEALSNEKAKKEEEEKFISLSVPVKGRVSLHGEFISRPETFCNYTESVTDQTHALSIAQQVRRGQGDAEKPEKAAYDFPDGRDDGSEAHGIFDFAERADAWIAEQNLADDLKKSFRQQVLQQQADKAMKEEALKSSQTLGKGPQSVSVDKVDDKSSTVSK